VPPDYSDSCVSFAGVQWREVPPDYSDSCVSLQSKFMFCLFLEEEGRRTRTTKVVSVNLSAVALDN